MTMHLAITLFAPDHVFEIWFLFSLLPYTKRIEKFSSLRLDIDIQHKLLPGFLHTPRYHVDKIRFLRSNHWTGYLPHSHPTSSGFLG
eukprot:UN24239